MELGSDGFSALDFLWLIFSPEISENGCKIAYKLGWEVIGEVKVSNRSVHKEQTFCVHSLHSQFPGYLGMSVF